MLRINPTNVCIYYRVSTKSQTEDGCNGLEMQTDLCEGYASKFFNFNKSSIYYYRDVGSMYKRKSKPRELLDLVDSLEEYPNTLILIHDISRMGRDIMTVHSILKKIREYKCYVVSVIDNLCYGLSRIDDKAFLHKVVDAECSSDIKSDIQTKRIAARKKNGKYTGCIPYGYKLLLNGTLTTQTREQNIIKNIIASHSAYMKPKEIYNDLVKRKVKKRGEEWTISGIKYLIKKHGSGKIQMSNINITPSLPSSPVPVSRKKKVSKTDLPLKKTKKVTAKKIPTNKTITKVKKTKKVTGKLW